MKAVQFFHEWNKKNNPFFPNGMRWDEVTIHNMLKEFDEQNELKPITRKFDPSDYIVLNPIGELKHIGENEIAVGVRNFLLQGQDCLIEYEYEGKKYKRKHTDIIPKDLVGKICSVQIYELIIE